MHQSLIDSLGTWLLSILSKDAWGILGNWFSGLATVFVVFLALGLQIWYERRKRPKLKLIYSPTDDNDNRYVLLNNSQMPIDSSANEEPITEELWLRINVLNRSKVTAEDVELRFLYSTIDGNPVKEDRPSWWFKVSNLNRFSTSIPPKFKQPFDIAYIKNNANVDKDLSAFIAIVPPTLGDDWNETKKQMELSPENHLKVGTTYRFVFAVVSSNADAIYYELKYKVADRSSHDLPKRNLQTKEVFRRRLEIGGPTPIDGP